MNNSFASGRKRHYYGKGDVIVYRLKRKVSSGDAGNAVFGANVMMLLYGDAFWKTYTTGDNTGVIATDSMRNFIQRETMNFEGHDLEGFCRFLAEKFLARYAQVEGLQISATEIPYAGISGAGSFAPAGPDRATASVELNHQGVVDVASGIEGFKLLRLGGSAFRGFVRDEYTTLPELQNRPLHMWLDLEWSYITSDAGFSEGVATSLVRSLVRDIFTEFDSGSIQQVIYQIGTRILEQLPVVAEIRLEANNRTWDTIAEQDDRLGVYTDARPPFGCLGLTLTR